jgi:hypothetical protein
MLSKELRNAFFQFSRLGPAICGVKVMFGRVNSLCSGAGGYSTMTSRPAPRIRSVISAS